MVAGWDNSNEMKSATIKRQGIAAWRGQIVIGLLASALIWMFLQSFMIVDATTFENATSTTYRASESFGDDSSIVVTSMGIRKVTSTKASSGDSSPGIEASSSYPQVNTELGRGNYAYTFQVKEATSNSFGANDSFQIQVYGDDGQAVTLLATFYIRQADVEEGQVEGINAVIDLGSATDIFDRFDIIVTRQ